MHDEFQKHTCTRIAITSFGDGKTAIIVAASFRTVSARRIYSYDTVKWWQTNLFVMSHLHTYPNIIIYISLNDSCIPEEFKFSYVSFKNLISSVYIVTCKNSPLCKTFSNQLLSIIGWFPNLRWGYICKKLHHQRVHLEFQILLDNTSVNRWFCRDIYVKSSSKIQETETMSTCYFLVRRRKTTCNIGSASLQTLITKDNLDIRVHNFHVNEHWSWCNIMLHCASPPVELHFENQGYKPEIHKRVI